MHLTNSLIQGSIIMALLTGITACNGADNSNKATDSVTTAPAVTKVKQKKKGQTSVAGLVADSAKLAKDAHGVYNHAEVAPEFPGGQSALASYINKNLKYPQSDIDNDTSGTLHITFIVDEHGKVLNPKALDGKNLGDGLVNPTLDVFKNMPMWTPGLVHGKKVKTRLEVPVTFQLADSDQ
jgi:hypothetical protein